MTWWLILAAPVAAAAGFIVASCVLAGRADDAARKAWMEWERERNRGKEQT